MDTRAVDWKVHAKEVGLARAKENWLGHDAFAITREIPEAVAVLNAIVAGYSGWHWLNRDPRRKYQVPARARLAEISAPTLVLVGQMSFHTFTTLLKF